MERYPNVIIGGAPKCGTSSLFFWLAAHPSVCASRQKETYFLAPEVNRFNRELNIIEHGLEAYSQHFLHCGNEKLRLEATPIYIFYDKTIEFVKQLPEKPKMVFILRKPGDRIYSHWRFNRYRMKNIRMSFEEYCNPDNIPHHWKKNYFENTHYINYLQKWVDALGKQNILVYQFEKLIQERHSFMKQLAEDLGIEGGFYDDFDFLHRNESVAIKNKRLHKISLKLETLVPQKLQEALIPIYLKVNANRIPGISEKDRELRESLNSQFTESNKKLKELFPGIDLSFWESKF